MQQRISQSQTVECKPRPVISWTTNCGWSVFYHSHPGRQEAFIKRPEPFSPHWLDQAVNGRLVQEAPERERHRRSHSSALMTEEKLYCHWSYICTDLLVLNHVLNNCFIDMQGSAGLDHNVLKVTVTWKRAYFYIFFILIQYYALRSKYLCIYIFSAVCVCLAGWLAGWMWMLVCDPVGYLGTE